MANIEKKISKKLSPDGKSQIMVRFVIGHSCMIRLKSNVFVAPSLFDSSIGDIIIPKRSKLNQESYNEAVMAKADLDNFIGRVSGIIAAGTPNGEPITKDWIERLMGMQDNKEIALNTQHLTKTKIETALKKEEEINERVKAQKEEEEREAAKIQTELAKSVDSFLLHNKLSDGRIRHYKVLQGMINRYSMYKREIGDNKSFALYLDSVSYEDIQDFIEYIRNEVYLVNAHKRIFNKIDKVFPFASNPNKPRHISERGNNYVSSKVKQLKAVINWHIKQGLTTNNPMVRLDMTPEIYGTPIYITRAERDTIADFDLSGAPKHLQEQRDIFIFQCLIGCRVGDLVKLTAANVCNGVLEYVPNKTKDHIQQVKPRVPLSQRAIDLIAKYQGKDKEGRLFPFVKAQNYNDNIKNIFKLCGITRNVIVRDSVSGQNVLKPIWQVASSHMARRTFVGAAYKAVKDPNLIGAMSGHVPGSQAFNRYRKIDDEDLKSVISLIG